MAIDGGANAYEGGATEWVLGVNAKLAEELLQNWCKRFR